MKKTNRIILNPYLITEGVNKNKTIGTDVFISFVGLKDPIFVNTPTAILFLKKELQ